MLSTREEEILQFIQEFEHMSLDYLKSKGTRQTELADAYLQMQWEFLHTIMNNKRKKSASPNNIQSAQTA